MTSDAGAMIQLMDDGTAQNAAAMWEDIKLGGDRRLGENSERRESDEGSDFDDGPKNIAGDAAESLRAATDDE